MENLDLTYYPYERYEDNDEEIKKFFDMQVVIKNDFEKLLEILKKYKDSEAKCYLIKHVNYVINSILLNRNLKTTDMHLDIVLNDKYLIFSYYDFKDDELIFETPTIVIMERNLHEIYFITETYSIFDEEKEANYDIDPDYNYGNDEIRYFQLNNHEIIQEDINMKEYTSNLFSSAFYDTELFIKNLKDKNNKIRKK